MSAMAATLLANQYQQPCPNHPNHPNHPPRTLQRADSLKAPASISSGHSARMSRFAVGGRTNPLHTSSSQSHLSSTPSLSISTCSSRPLSCASNSPVPRCVGRFRSFTSTSSSSSISSAGLNAIKWPSRSSSSTAIFKPHFLRHRARRLSDCSLTDLTPPTADSDLDFEFRLPPESTPHPANPSSPKSSSPSPHQGMRRPDAHSGARLPKLLPSKPSELLNVASTRVFRSDGCSSASSVRFPGLRPKLFNNQKAGDSHNQTHLTANKRSTQIYLRRKDSLSSLRDVVTTAQPSNSQTEVEELKSICFPRRPLWVDTDSVAKMNNNSLESGFGAKTVTSPGPFPVASFSRRSSEDFEGRPSNRSSHSPRRGRAPPPIKVPKLRAALVAITAHGETSPNSSDTPIVVSRHRTSGSEGNVIRERRCGGMGWPPLSHSQSFSDLPPPLAFRGTSFNREASCPWPGAFEDLAEPSSTEAQTLILASQRQSQQALEHDASSDSQLASIKTKPPLPLLISRHTRSLISPSASQARVSPTSITSPCSVSPASTPTSAINARTALVCHDPSNPDKTRSRVTSVNPPHRISLANPSSHAQTGSRTANPVSSPSSIDEDPRSDDVFFSPSSMLPQTPRVQRLPKIDFQTRYRRRMESATSFDVRNLPFQLDGSISIPPSPPLCSTPQPSAIPPSTSVPPPLIAIPQLPPVPSISDPVSSSSSSANTSRSNSDRRLVLAPPLAAVPTLLPSVRSHVSNSSTTTNLDQNRVLTPSASAGSTHLAHTDAPGISRPRSRSADDIFVPGNDGTRKSGSRPRSMSDRGSDRATLCLNRQNISLEATAVSGEIDIRGHPDSSPSFPWVTCAIEVHLRGLEAVAQGQIIAEALKLYPTDAHRFVVGDITELMEEGRQCRQRVQKLRVRYLAGVAKRERLLKQHIVTLRASHGDEAARFGDSLLKSIHESDESVSELLTLVDHTSRIERLCESHWRAAATAEISTLETTRGKLNAAEDKIRSLELAQGRNQRRIEELEERLLHPFQRSDAEQMLRKGSLPNLILPSLPLTSAMPASFPKPASNQPPPLVIRPPTNINTTRTLRGRNVVNASERIMSSCEVPSNPSQCGTFTKSRTPLLQTFNRRPAAVSVEETLDTRPITPRRPLYFEFPRAAPLAPLPTPEPDPGPDRTLQPVMVPLEISAKSMKRPGLQFSQAARNLFSSNLRRKACEQVNSPATTAHSPRPLPNQFATWSPETVTRRYEPLENLFKPPTIEEEGVQKNLLLGPDWPHISPAQVSPTGSQFAPPPLPPAQSSPVRGEAGRLRSKIRRESDAMSLGGVGGNLKSITLSQLGSLDIAHLLTSLASTTPSPTLCAFNQPSVPPPTSPTAFA